MYLSIVVPVYNEQETLAELYNRIQTADLPEHEIIFIDDGSTDKSPAILAGLAARDTAVRVVSFWRNYGQTYALSCGFAKARGEWVVTIDADLQNDAADIVRLIEKTKEQYDVVSGWRKKRKDSFLLRTLPSRLANMLISFLTAVPLHDYGCTLKIYRTAVIRDLPLFGEMHRFLPAYVAWKGARVAEIEVNHFPRLSGSSHYGFERIFKVFLDLLVAKFFLSYLSKPIYIFGGASLASGIFSLGIAGIVIVRKFYFAGVWISPLLFIALFFSGVSVVCLLMGFLAEILIRVYFEQGGRKPYQIREEING